MGNRNNSHHLYCTIGGNMPFTIPILKRRINPPPFYGIKCRSRHSAIGVCDPQPDKLLIDSRIIGCGLRIHLDSNIAVTVRYYIKSIKYQKSRRRSFSIFYTRCGSVTQSLWVCDPQLINLLINSIIISNGLQTHSYCNDCYLLFLHLYIILFSRCGSVTRNLIN